MRHEQIRVAHATVLDHPKQTSSDAHLCPECPKVNCAARCPEQTEIAPAVTKRMTMKEIFAHTGTDKLTRHAYHRYYDIWLERFYGKAGLRMLEIGADTGKSLSAWAMYFQTPPIIHGLSYGVGKPDYKGIACGLDKTTCENITVFFGDQSTPDTLATLVKDGALVSAGDDITIESQGWSRFGYDIIIDDGSHVPEHILKSFKALFPVVRPGGIYVVEVCSFNHFQQFLSMIPTKVLCGFLVQDLECGYWDTSGATIYGKGLPGAGIGKTGSGNSVEKFKQLADVLMRYHIGFQSLSVFGKQVDHYIHSIEFGENLLVIRKKTGAQVKEHPNVQGTLNMVNKNNVASWQKQAQSTNVF